MTLVLFSREFVVTSIDVCAKKFQHVRRYYCENAKDHISLVLEVKNEYYPAMVGDSLCLTIVNRAHEYDDADGSSETYEAHEPHIIMSGVRFFVNDIAGRCMFSMGGLITHLTFAQADETRKYFGFDSSKKVETLVHFNNADVIQARRFV